MNKYSGMFVVMYYVVLVFGFSGRSAAGEHSPGEKVRSHLLRPHTNTDYMPRAKRTRFSQECKKATTAENSQALNKFMRQNGLVLEGEEYNYSEIGIVSRWELHKMVPTHNGCFAVMSLCVRTKEKKGCEVTGYDVLGYIPGKANPIVAFEEFHSTPKTLIAKIGSNPKDKDSNSDLSFYYAKLTGKNAIEATKSVVADIPYGGFSGIAVRGKKASFDPTANRDWQVTDASYSLRRGASAEGLDIQAFQFDGLQEGGSPNGYWKGCFNSTGKPNACDISPWYQAYIRELIPAL